MQLYGVPATIALAEHLKTTKYKFTCSRLHTRSAPPKLRSAGHIRPAKVFYVARVAVIEKSFDYSFSRHHETIKSFIIRVLSALTKAPRFCEYDLSTLQTQVNTSCTFWVKGIVSFTVHYIINFFLLPSTKMWIANAARGNEKIAHLCTR
jgi:hypothetical protein